MLLDDEVLLDEELCNELGELDEELDDVDDCDELLRLEGLDEDGELELEDDGELELELEELELEEDGELELGLEDDGELELGLEDDGELELELEELGELLDEEFSSAQVQTNSPDTGSGTIFGNLPSSMHSTILSCEQPPQVRQSSWLTSR